MVWVTYTKEWVSYSGCLTSPLILFVVWNATPGFPVTVISPLSPAGVITPVAQLSCTELSSPWFPLQLILMVDSCVINSRIATIVLMLSRFMLLIPILREMIVSAQVDLSVPHLLCGDCNQVFDRGLDRFSSTATFPTRDSCNHLRALFRDCCGGFVEITQSFLHFFHLAQIWWLLLL